MFGEIPEISLWTWSLRSAGTTEKAGLRRGGFLGQLVMS
jgi:hypothetical protein